MTDGIRAAVEAAEWLAGLLIGLALVLLVLCVCVGLIAIALEAVASIGRTLEPLRWRLRARRTARRLHQGTRR